MINFLWEIVSMPLLKLKLKRSKGIVFLRFSRIDNSTEFEGANRLGISTKLKRSYIGYGSYLARNTKLEKVYIGRYCSIGENVEVINGNHPVNKFVSTHPAFYSKKNVSPISYVHNERFEEIKEVDVNNKKYSVCIRNDVWIGSRAIILGGITVGNGAVVAAGAVVTKNVPPYAIVAGVPAKVIRYRFEKDQIDKLLKIKWWEHDEEWLRKNADDFEDIENFVMKFGGNDRE